MRTQLDVIDQQFKIDDLGGSFLKQVVELFLQEPTDATTNAEITTPAITANIGETYHSHTEIREKVIRLYYIKITEFRYKVFTFP